MHRKLRLRSYLFAGLLGALALLGAPTAGAQGAPEPAPLVDVGAFVEQVRDDLSHVGINTAPVDPVLTDAVDQVLTEVIPTPATVTEETVEPAAPEPYSATAEFADPNYRWESDLSSKVLAGKPTADHVLHRVAGSWFDAPRIPEESVLAQNRGNSLYGPGTPIYIGDSKMCTLGVAGTDAAGRKVGLTAGHCGEPGEQVASADSWQLGPTGTVVASNAHHDYSVIEFGSNTELTRSYNGVTVNQVGGAPATTGQQLCKQGVATGFTCGITWVDDRDVQFSQVCASVGDSGGPVLVGDRLVGLVSGGSLPNPALTCRSPLQGALFMPTVSTSMNAVLAHLNATGGPGSGFVLAS